MANGRRSPPPRVPATERFGEKRNSECRLPAPALARHRRAVPVVRSDIRGVRRRSPLSQRFRARSFRSGDAALMGRGSRRTTQLSLVRTWEWIEEFKDENGANRFMVCVGLSFLFG